MKLSCTQENLNRGLLISSHIASKNINLPILNNVLFKAEGGIITLLATNLEIGIKCAVRGKIESEGAITLPAKLFADYVSSLPNDKIDLELLDQTFEIKCKNYETRIRGAATSEFPLIPEVEKVAGYSLDVGKFHEAVNQVVFAVSTNEIRPEISGLLLRFDGQNKKVVVAATDSYRLAEKSVGLASNENENSREVIVPARTMQEVLRILSVFRDIEDSETPNLVKIYLAENQIMFSLNGVDLVSRVIDGQYPDYKQIIPGSWQTRAGFSRNELIRVVKTASLFAKPGIFDVTFVFKPGKEKMGELILSSANSQFGENTVKLEAETEGKENEITLNYRYLLDGLGAMETDEVVLELTSADSPCLLRPKAEGADYLYIVMPIKK
jgi:DNA polymerase-3 subunit beta